MRSSKAGKEYETMKLREIIQEAVTETSAEEMCDTILACAREESHRPVPVRQGKRRVPWRGICAAAAVVCLLTVSASAYMIAGGFYTAFGKALETGGIRILSAVSDNEDVSFEITEVWFDEYCLRLGGTVTLPEVLPEGEYWMFCRIRNPEETRSFGMIGTLYPNGTAQVPFVISSAVSGDGKGNFRYIGFETDTITAEITIRAIYDSKEPPLEECVLYAGPWQYTAELTRQEDEIYTLEGPYTGETQTYTRDGGMSTQQVRVDSVTLTPFSMVLTGEGLVYRNGRELPAEVPDGQNYICWIRMKDGTYMGKRSGLYAEATPEGWQAYKPYGRSDLCVVIFSHPIDWSQADAILLVRDPGISIQPDGTRTEVWETVAEIPVSLP